MQPVPAAAGLLGDRPGRSLLFRTFLDNLFDGRCPECGKREFWGVRQRFLSNGDVGYLIVRRAASVRRMDLSQAFLDRRKGMPFSTYQRLMAREQGGPIGGPHHADFCHIVLKNQCPKGSGTWRVCVILKADQQIPRFCLLFGQEPPDIGQCGVSLHELTNQLNGLVGSVDFDEGNRHTAYFVAQQERERLRRAFLAWRQDGLLETVDLLLQFGELNLAIVPRISWAFSGFMVHIGARGYFPNSASLHNLKEQNVASA